MLEVERKTEVTSYKLKIRKYESGNEEAKIYVKNQTKTKKKARN